MAVVIFNDHSLASVCVLDCLGLFMNKINVQASFATRIKFGIALTTLQLFLVVVVVHLVGQEVVVVLVVYYSERVVYQGIFTGF